MEDKASSNPGEMGWGFDDYQREDERRLFGEMQAADGGLFCQKPIREPVSQEFLELIKGEQVADGIDGGISLRHVEPVVFGAFLLWLRQIIGSCVGSSFMRGATLRMLWESFVLGDPEQIFGTTLLGQNNVAPFAPYGYRAGRKLGGLNRGDGSFCSVQIRGAKEYGILPCDAVGLERHSDEFPEPQNASTYRKWGNSDSLLNEFAPQARKFKLLESEKVSDAGLAKTLITEHFKPLQICSMWAFKPASNHPTWKLRDGSTVVVYERDRRTSWAHAMLICAVVEVGGRWYAIVLNSWGNAHRNGDWFAIPLELLDTWLRDAECLSIGDIDMKDNVLPGGE